MWLWICRTASAVEEDEDPAADDNGYQGIEVVDATTLLRSSDAKNERRERSTTDTLKQLEAHSTSSTMFAVLDRIVEQMEGEEVETKRIVEKALWLAPCLSRAVRNGGSGICRC